MACRLLSIPWNLDEKPSLIDDWRFWNLIIAEFEINSTPLSLLELWLIFDIVEGRIIIWINSNQIVSKFLIYYSWVVFLFCCCFFFSFSFSFQFSFFLPPATQKKSSIDTSDWKKTKKKITVIFFLVFSIFLHR